LKEIVQKILETEKEAHDGIENARVEAQRIIRKAEDQSGQIEAGVREKAVLEAQKITERIKKEAEEERQRQIDAAQGGSAELIKKKSAEIEEAAENVTNLILGIERKQGKLL
jgi:vacuolar-type H+-ATPase subunit H